MSTPKLRGVFLGLTITSTWGNGHATTYRALLKEFAALGHQITFLERNVPWYESNREFSELPYCEINLYSSTEELKQQYRGLIRNADFVVVGSYVPDGIAIGEWIVANATGLKAFYDIDTPVTLANLDTPKCEYLTRSLVALYDLYLSFTGGPTLTYLEKELHSPAARALYCSVDSDLYYPDATDRRWDLAYLGTYAEDRQPAVKQLLMRVAEVHPKLKFAVAGPQYPDTIVWPENVERIAHLPASEHRDFYSSQAFTLNLTRRDMVRSGYSPSVRLFEAAACGVPIITDTWPGLESIFTPHLEIFPVETMDDVSTVLRLPDERRRQVAEKARKKVIRHHTAKVRAEELQCHILAACERGSHPTSRSKTPVSRAESGALL